MDWAALQTRVNSAALAAFGATITLNGVAVRGDFVSPSNEIDLDGAMVVDNVPQAIVASASVPAEPVGKTCVVAGVSYTVADARPDGYGLTRLLLERAL